MNDPEVSQEFSNHIVGIVDQTHTIGQSFISRHEHLNGITLWVTTVIQNDPAMTTGQLVVKLYSSDEDTQPLHASSLQILPAWQNSQVEINLPPQDNSSGHSYYIEVESTGGAVQFLGRNEDAYPNGMAYSDGRQLAADLAFRTTYDYNIESVFQDLSNWGSQAGFLFPLALTLFLPGWILLDITGLRRRYDLAEQAAISIGLSLAIIPLLMLWTSVLHIQWTRSSLFWVLGFIASFYLARFCINFYRSGIIKHTASDSHMGSTIRLRNAHFFRTVALIGIVGGVFFVRLAMVRDLATPAWVDSVHHAIITRLIIQNGGFPASYIPYMDFDVHNYHVGFHSGLAVFTWLSGLELPDAMLIYGQAINALAALSVYLLTTTVTRKPSAGIFAAFITGFLTPMPAYYTSWGRYTQLTGLLILPPILSFLIPAFRQSISDGQQIRPNRISTIMATLAISGLFLVHYRVLAFAIMLLIASLTTYLPRHSARLSTNLSQWLVISISCLTGAVLLVSPWFIPALNHIFLPKLAPPDSTQAVFFGDFSWRYLTTAYGKQTLVFASLGIVWMLLKSPRHALTLILWIIQLLFFANLDALKLPGGGFITGTSVVIMFFIPVSLLGGYFLSEVISSWNSVLASRRIQVVRFAFLGVVTVATALIAALGARQLLPIINPVTILSRQADRTALDWISHNIPTGSSFLINPFSWGFGLYAGSDGGYWISPVTGLRTMPPPALYGLGNSDTVNGINSICQLATGHETTAQQLHDVMIVNQIDYIYLGLRGGPLSPLALLQSGLFEQVYSSNGIWILKLLALH